jgi:hypothetical protein
MLMSGSTETSYDTTTARVYFVTAPGSPATCSFHHKGRKYRCTAWAGLGIVDVPPSDTTGTCSPFFRSIPPQYSCDAQVLIDIQPMNAQRHDLEIRRCLAFATLSRGYHSTGAGQRYDQLGRRERNCRRTQVADFKFQSAHSRRSTVDHNGSSSDG